MQNGPHTPPPEFPRAPPTRYAGTRADAARWARDVLRNQILEGAFGGLAAARPALPPESALASEMGISRNAIREALNLLRDEGLVTRIQGSGTFVTGAKLRQQIDKLEGLAESLAGHHLPVDNTVLSARQAGASPFVAAKLGIDEGSPIFFVERLRSVGGIPLSLDTSYLRAEAIEILEGADLEHDDVFVLLEKGLGQQLGWAEVTVEAVAADETTAELLEVAPATPLLLVHRVTHLESGVPFDMESVRYRGDRFTLGTTTTRDRSR